MSNLSYDLQENQIVLTPMFKPTVGTTGYNSVRTNNRRIEIHAPATDHNHWLNVGGSQIVEWADAIISPAEYRADIEDVSLDRSVSLTYSLPTARERYDIQFFRITEKLLSEYLHLVIVLRFGESRLRRTTYWMFERAYLDRRIDE